jgi:hypothetical protein
MNDFIAGQQIIFLFYKEEQVIKMLYFPYFYYCSLIIIVRMFLKMTLIQQQKTFVLTSKTFVQISYMLL